MSDSPHHLPVSVALEGTGWHPASWREADARPTEVLTARYWTGLISEADRGELTFVTIEDGLALQSDNPNRSDDRTDRVRGRLDAVLIAARTAPLTKRIGLVPTAVVTHTEPFHLSKAIATLDYVSSGRAGIRVQVSAAPHVAAHFGRRLAEPPFDVLDEAADYVEVLRRLWDSWEDDAEIRDVASGRFIDRNKLHYIDFQGPYFSVRGPSITPRPPQGQPVVAALGHVDAAYELIATSADIGFVTPHSAAEAGALVADIAARRGAAREPVQVFADLVVLLDASPAEARARQRRLDERLGREYRSDAEVFVGTPAELADVLVAWHASGITGFRLRPATLPHDLLQITEGVIPELRRRGVCRPDDAATTLRGALGLTRPANRYVGSPQ